MHMKYGFWAKKPTFWTPMGLKWEIANAFKKMILALRRIFWSLKLGKNEAPHLISLVTVEFIRKESFQEGLRTLGILTSWRGSEYR